MSGDSPSMIKIAEIKEAIGKYRYNIQSEMDLHRSLEEVFNVAGIDYVHEYALGKTGAIDFFIDGIGIEVKTKGSPSAIIRQLHKYLEHDEIECILLVTTRNTHRVIPREISGKTVELMVISPGL